MDQLEGMTLGEEAWGFISSETIANCWRHTQILSPRNADGSVMTLSNDLEPSVTLANSSTPADPASYAILKLSDALKELNSSCVAPRDHMTAEEWLDSAEELVTEMEWTDGDIVEQTNAEVAAQGDGSDNASETKEEDEPPLYTATQAIVAIRELDRLFRVSTGTEFTTAIPMLRAAARRLRAERQLALVQNTVNSYFSRSDSSSQHPIIVD